MWRSLTPTQVASWNNYALTINKRNRVNGRAFHPSGFEAFLGLGCKYLQVNPGGTVPTTPPSTPFSGDAITFTVTPGTGKLTFTPSAANSANTTTEFLVQALANGNRKPQKKQYRSKGFHQFTNTDPFDLTLGAGYYAVQVSFVNKNTSQETTPFSEPIQQVAFAVQTGGKSIQKKAA